MQDSINFGVHKQLAHKALWAATLAFTANFAIWTLYAVMGIEIRQQLNLTATELGFLLAAPMLSGALLRFPMGFLTERYNCKKLFIYQMLLLLPVLIGMDYVTSYWGFLAIGLLLGISGVSFTIGIEYVSSWFESKHQGTAMGIFGTGNVGAAFTLLVTPFIVSSFGWQSIGLFFALIIFAVIIVFTLCAPAQVPVVSQKQYTPYLMPLTDFRVWRFGLYYYFVFGSFLALILWLPQYYINAYGLSFEQAMSHTLVFVFVSSSVRALGGWFADLYGAIRVNWGVFWVCLVCLFLLSYPPTTMTVHGIEDNVELSLSIDVWLFSGILLVIGIAQGVGRASVYKVIHVYYPTKMGSVGGFVAACGALGGCTLPVLFGVAEDVVGVYSACFMLLYGILAVCMIVLHIALKTEKHQQRLEAALANNFLEQDE